MRRCCREKICTVFACSYDDFLSSTLAFATDKTDTQDNSTSDESDGGSMPTDFAIILLLIAGGTAVASFKRHRNDRDDYDEPDDDTEEEI